MAHDTFKRIGIWALERFLPKQNVLAAQLRNIVKGAMLMVMGGLIVTSVFIGGLIGLQVVLTDQGLHPGLATAIVGSFALLCAFLCFMQADKILRNIMHDDLDEERPKIPAIKMDVTVQDGIALAIGSFLNGLRGRPAQKSEQPDLFEIPEKDAVIHFPRDSVKKK